MAEVTRVSSMRSLASSQQSKIYAFGLGKSLPNPYACSTVRLRRNTFAETIIEQMKLLPHNDGVLYELFHAVDHSVAIIRGHQTAATFCCNESILVRRVNGIGELSVSLWDRRLVQNREHTHPAAEDP